MNTVSISLAVGAFILLFLLALAGLVNASSPADLYYRLPLFLYDQFPFSWLVVLIVAGALAWMVTFLTKEAHDIFPGTVSDSEILVGFAMWGGGFVLVATFAGGFYSSKVRHECDLTLVTFPRCPPVEGVLELVMMVVVIPVQIFVTVGYSLLWLIFLPLIGAFLVAALPQLIAGYVGAVTSHPAAHSVTRAASHDRPTSVHQELAAIMARQEIDDERAAALIHQMSPVSQFIARMRYSKRIKEAKRLRELVETRVKALEEDAGMAHDVLDMERRKRDRY